MAWLDDADRLREAWAARLINLRKNIRVNLNDQIAGRLCGRRRRRWRAAVAHGRWPRPTFALWRCDAAQSQSIAGKRDGGTERMSPDIHWHVGEDDEQETIAHCNFTAPFTPQLDCDLDRRDPRRGSGHGLSLDPRTRATPHPDATADSTTHSVSPGQCLPNCTPPSIAKRRPWLTAMWRLSSRSMNLQNADMFD